MNRMRLVLVAICGLLAIAAIMPWVGGKPPHSGTQAAADDSSESQPAISFNDPGPLDSYSETLRRPVFLTARRPAEVLADSAPGAALLLGRYQVAGVVIAGERRIVLIRQGAGDKVSRLTQGAELDGWTLAEVTRRHLVLEKAGQRQEFVLQQGDSSAD